MTEVDLSRPTRIHMVAIGGKAMSAMAEILLAMGHHVTGSDLVDGPELAHLRSLGATVVVGHDAANVGDAGLVACSTAVSADNVERQAALRRGIPVVSRPELQGSIVGTRRALAVSGTHGKSSTTAMLVTICNHAGLDVSYIVGARIGNLGSARLGSGEWFVVEADESDGTFLQLGAEVAVVTNVDADHLDQWGSLDAIEAGFDRFLSEATGGSMVGVDDPIANRLGARHGSLGVGLSPGADWRIVEPEVGRGVTRFTLIDPSGASTDVAVPEPGVYNARNAAMAIAAAHHLGVPVPVAVEALARYAGLERRFQVRGEVGGVTVVDDYAHNPAKVTAVLAAAAAGGWDRVLAVFQPHRYSRTADLWASFADSFVDADIVWVTELDPSGEPHRDDISGSLIWEAARRAHPDADIRWAPDREALIAEVVGELQRGDLCITIGAGDITTLPSPLLEKLGETSP
ncbi:MAG: UDP-N-acetylmuramate--L-alanine ligase [Acidimicrobiales bacterium]|nr:UDP-N-acetylmuramate--L-alanine ligase [Acidimicrobiales bacterium]